MAKMGRPTDDPKEIKLTVRVNKKTNAILEKYCEQNRITKVEGVRQAIQNLKIKK